MVFTLQGARRSGHYGGMEYLAILFLFITFASGVSAFGAGTTSTGETRWRHGDVEKALLGLTLARSAGGLTFTKIDVKRVYFGNWLRDYSQIMDVGSLKVVGPNVLRTLVTLFSFMTFGYATGEFEVTENRLSVYRPEEHLDNPKDYANNIDAKKYDKRLRGVVDEVLELSVDDRTGMKIYIANERSGVTTTAGYVRKTLGRCIKLGRQYTQKQSFKDLDDALRYLGAALHALEDFPAHSNYVELALRELGERSVFPHVGTANEIEVRGHQVFPLVTGTFGSVDFLSNVLGGDPKNQKPTELQQLEELFRHSLETDGQHGGEIKLLREHFAVLPKGLLNEKCIANLDYLEDRSKAKQEEVKAKADDGDAVDLDASDLTEQIYPYLEMHDRVVREIVYGMEEVPSHAATYEKIQKSVCIVTFTLIAPYILPVLQQARIELAESANEVISIAEDKQYTVFTDPYASDPVHSVLSKDHANNVLAEPAGRVATEIVKFVVPRIMRAWDEEEMEVDPLIDYILGVFHHPVCRNENKHSGQNAMFTVVREWWTEKSDEEKDRLRANLGMDGIREHLNTDGEDAGHGGSSPIAGEGIMPGDATGGIFNRKPEDDDNGDDGKEEDAAESPAEIEGEAPAENNPPDAAAVVQENGRAHRKKREGRKHRDREGGGSQSPNKREHRRKHQSGEIPDDRVRSKESRRKYQDQARDSQGELADREHRHRRHRDDRPDREQPEEKPKENKSRLSQMFTSGLSAWGFGQAASDQASNKPSDSKLHGKSSNSEDRRRREDRHERHRQERSEDPNKSPPRHRSSRKRDNPRPVDAAIVDSPEMLPQAEGEADALAGDQPPLIEATAEEPGAEAAGEEKKGSKRRSSRRREARRDTAAKLEGGTIPEEGDYFRSHHPEQDLPPTRTKANKILGIDGENGDIRKHKPKRRHTDRDPTSERRGGDEEPAAKGGLFGRMRSRADKLFGREGEEPPRLERRRTEDHREHLSRPHKRNHPDDDERRHRKHRSVTLPVRVDSTDFADGGNATAVPDIVENGVPGSFPAGDDIADEPSKEEKRRHRKHRSSPNPLQFDVPSEGSGSEEKKSRSRHKKRRDEGGTPELQDVGGLGIETPQLKPHRRRQRDSDDTPTPSPRRDRTRKKPAKEVNFEDQVDSGDAHRSKSRRHRSSRDELADEGEGSRERRRKERKRDSAVFGGYGRD